MTKRKPGARLQRPWTAEEDALVSRDHPCWHVVAEQLGRSFQAVHSRRKRLGLAAVKQAPARRSRAKPRLYDPWRYA